MTEIEEPKLKYRTTLPSVMVSQGDANIWAVLKNCLGKDLCKITMPVTLNEPLSFLQRICEYMEYAYLLTTASQQEHPANRIKFVAAFAVSALASNWERIGKPFNPLLGETFELQRNDYKIVCEQVSHHPPISAFHAESPDYKFYGSICPKIKFMGKTIEIHPKGTVTVELLRWKETYTWNNVNCYIHNIVMGKLWIEQAGIMNITSHNNGYRAKIHFKNSTSSKEMCTVHGVIKDNRSKNIYSLYGKWNEFLRCTEKNISVDSKEESLQDVADSHVHKKKPSPKLHAFKMSSLFSLSIQNNENEELGTSENIEKNVEIPTDFDKWELLWKCNWRPETSSKYYQFSTFAMQLNEIEPGMKPPSTLCPTDSRLRPDIRFLEIGDLESASVEKYRLEEKQRQTKQSRKHSDESDLKARWFELREHPHIKTNDWLFNGTYWNRSYNDVDEIF